MLNYILFIYFHFDEIFFEKLFLIFQIYSHEKIHQLPKLLNEIFIIIKNFESSDNEDMRIREQIKIINEKLKPKQTEIHNIIKKICDKEAIVVKKLSVIDPADIEKANRNLNFQTLNTYDSNTNLQTEEDNKRPSVLGFRESKIIVQDVLDQNTYLEIRTKELEDIKKVATQIKDLSNSMKSELEDQGKKVDQIDKNVDEVKINVVKAEFEIQEADKNSRSDSKRIKCLAYMIILLLLALGFVVLKIFVF